jgi:outer membrane immunogenic protein
MRKYIFPSVAVLGLMASMPAVAADLPLKAPAPFVERFTWTGCYLGGHLGGGFAHNDVTDPVQVVQDAFLGAGTTVGVSTTSPSSTGAVVGGQIGCDYQFGGGWVVGIEGSASGSTMKGSATLPLPLGNPGENELVTARTDFLASVTGRVGYAFDRALLYGKGGYAWMGGKYDVSGIFQGTAFNFEGPEVRNGWTAGAGVEWAFSQHWSTGVEYDYYQFGSRNVLLSDPINALSGPVNTRLSVQVVKATLNFHMSDGW